MLITMPALSVCPTAPKHGFVRFDRESKSTEQGRTDDASLLEVCAWVGIGDWGGSRSLGGPHNNMVTVWATV